jgi:hypothetical protein
MTLTSCQPVAFECGGRVGVVDVMQSDPVQAGLGRESQ